MNLALGNGKRRADLIAICEAAIVPEKDWHDRDSYGAQMQVGECWALLRAGCDFHVHGTKKNPTIEPHSDTETIWVTTYGEGFRRFEHGGEVPKEDELSYLPTWKRLRSAAGKDWY